MKEIMLWVNNSFGIGDLYQGQLCLMSYTNWYPDMVIKTQTVLAKITRIRVTKNLDHKINDMRPNLS